VTWFADSKTVAGMYRPGMFLPGIPGAKKIASPDFP
jgi:hypothetical protein